MNRPGLREQLVERLLLEVCSGMQFRLSTSSMSAQATSLTSKLHVRLCSDVLLASA